MAPLTEREVEQRRQAARSAANKTRKHVRTRPREATISTPLDARAPVRETPKSRVKAAVRKDAKTVLAFGVAIPNNGARFVSDRSGRGFWTADDSITQDETAHIVNAVYAVLEDTNAGRKIIEWLAAAARSSRWGYLSYVGTMIALPRMIRHNLISADDPMVMALLFAGAAFEQQAAEYEAEQRRLDSEPDASAPDSGAPVPVGAGADAIYRGGNGNGQIDPRQFSVDVPPVRSDLPEQTG